MRKTILLLFTLLNFYYSEDVSWTRVYGGTFEDIYHPSAYVGGLSYSSPTFVDIDNDNDLDLFIGSVHRRKGLHFYENVGDMYNPEWMLIDDNFLSLPDSLSGGYSRPIFGDMDNDGDDDLFIVYWEYPGGSVRLFKNVGTPEEYDFIEINAEQALGLPQNTGGFEDADLIDINNDGKLELIGTTNRLITFENLSTLDSIKFNEIDMGFDIYGFGAMSITFGDLDNDNDYDCVVGASNNLYYLENTGNPRQADFSLMSGYFNSYIQYPQADQSSPDFADTDGDGDIDLYWGMDTWENGGGGFIFYMENTGTQSTAQWIQAEKKDIYLDFGEWTYPSLGDLDGDGDVDLVLFWGNGLLNREESLDVNRTYYSVLFNNEGVTGPNWIIEQENFFMDYKTVYFDMDGDNDLDAITNPNGDYLINESNGDSIIFINGPVLFDSLTSSLQDSLNDAWIFHRDIEDVDGDGDGDMVGIVRYLYYDIDPRQVIIFAENTGNIYNPVFSDYEIIYTHSGDWIHDVLLLDIDNDEDYDIFTLKRDYAVNGWVWNKQIVGIHRNIGTPNDPQWDNPEDYYLSDLNLPTLLSCTKGDLDNDGDLDIMFGTFDGGLVVLAMDSTTLWINGNLNIPNKITLHPNYPNPFNAGTNIIWDSNIQGDYKIIMYDVIGRKVDIIHQGKIDIGINKVFWNGKSSKGKILSSGIYFYRINVWNQNKKFGLSGKMVIIK